MDTQINEARRRHKNSRPLKISMYSMKWNLFAVRAARPVILNDMARRLAAAWPSCRSEEEARMRFSLISRLAVAAALGGMLAAPVTVRAQQDQNIPVMTLRA